MMLMLMLILILAMMDNWVENQVELVMFLDDLSSFILCCFVWWYVYVYCLRTMPMQF